MSLIDDIKISNLSEATEILKGDIGCEELFEKARKIGDEKVYQGVTYYVHALNSKGQPLWRKKKDGGGSSSSGSQSSAKEGNSGQAKPAKKSKWKVGDTKQYQGVTWVCSGFNDKGGVKWRKAKQTDNSGNTTKTATKKTTQAAEKPLIPDALMIYGNLKMSDIKKLYTDYHDKYRLSSTADLKKLQDKIGSNVQKQKDRYNRLKDSGSSKVMLNKEGNALDDLIARSYTIGRILSDPTHQKNLADMAAVKKLNYTNTVKATDFNKVSSDTWELKSSVGNVKMTKGMLPGDYALKITTSDGKTISVGHGNSRTTPVFDNKSDLDAAIGKVRNGGDFIFEGIGAAKKFAVGYLNSLSDNSKSVGAKSNDSNSKTYSHNINGVTISVSKNKDGSYTLEANGKKVKSDDPSFFKDKLTPRVKKALAKEVGIDANIGKDVVKKKTDKNKEYSNADFSARAKKESDVPLKKLRGKVDELEGNVTIGKSSYYLNIRTADNGKDYDVVVKDGNGNSRTFGLKTLANLSKQVKYEMKPSYKKVTELDGGGNMVVNSHKVKNAKLDKERI